MSILITLICFILILGITITFHEFGHFITAKKNGVYCYEFSIGMGPRLKKWTRKNDETEYSLRLFPIGGYVQMAGEEIDDDKSIPKDKKMQSKKIWQQLVIVLAGVFNNFLLAVILLFIVALIQGAPQNNAVVGVVAPSSAASLAGLEENDEIVSITYQNKTKEVKNYDDFSLYLALAKSKENKNITIGVNRDGSLININMTPTYDEENDTYSYGFQIKQDMETGLLASIKYAFTKTLSLMHQMLLIIFYLFTGALSLNSLSGPVGIYSIVGTAAAAGFVNVLYLMAYISINVGFINLIPFPAFDGFRALCLIIEKITHKKLNIKAEAIINAIGLILLLILMVVITYNDILKLIG